MSNSQTIPSFRRTGFDQLIARLRQPRRFIQVLAGPRQVGKTTLARQALATATLPGTLVSADEPTLRGRTWLEAQWGAARATAAGRRGAMIVLDEVQKIPAWSEVVKRLWDEDTASGLKLHVVILGSSPLLLQAGLTESLAGRFEILRLPHWSFSEMRDAFGWTLDRYVYFGGYPGSAPLIRDRERWARYIVDSLIETSVSRDILLLTRVDKPALLRRLFRLSCDYSGQILSYTKMLGQLQDAGNTTTLAHYLDLLAGAGMVAGLQKFSGSQVRQRGSSPKLLALNTALITASIAESPSQARSAPDLWGRLVETAVGAHLINTAAGTGCEVTYWREGSIEVDFVLRSGKELVAIEVTSGRRKDRRGLTAFKTHYPKARPLIVGADGIPLVEFLAHPASAWI